MLDKIEELKNKLVEEETRFKVFQRKLDEIAQSKYKIQEEILHLEEILRLAKRHFPRLRRQLTGDLTNLDYQELLKWVSRAKSSDGLKDIVEALKELSKYTPGQIKSNLYALVQKIIIEGPYKKSKNP